MRPSSVDDGEDIAMLEAFENLSLLNEAVAFSDWQVHVQYFEGGDAVTQDVMTCSVDRAETA